MHLDRSMPPPDFWLSKYIAAGIPGGDVCIVSDHDCVVAPPLSTNEGLTSAHLGVEHEP